MIYPQGIKQTAELTTNKRIRIKPYQVSSIINLYPCDHYVIHQPIIVQDKDHNYLRCLLRPIDKNILLLQLKLDNCCNSYDVFLSPSKLLQALRHYPALVNNTFKLHDACDIKMDYDTDKTMGIYGGSKEDYCILLEKLSLAGLHHRSCKRNKITTNCLHNELKVIYDLGFTTLIKDDHSSTII